MITSKDNPQLKTIRRLHDKRHREREGLVVAEGEDLVDAAKAAGFEPELVLVAGEDVEPRLLDAVSALGSGTRVIGVFRQRGSERAGLPEAVLERCSARACVPLREGGAESLNVAMAATVALYELNRIVGH